MLGSLIKANDNIVCRQRNYAVMKVNRFLLLILHVLTYEEQFAGSEQLSLRTEAKVNIESIMKVNMIGPLYHPRMPSAFKVFHKQSIGFR